MYLDKIMDSDCNTNDLVLLFENKALKAMNKYALIKEKAITHRN